MNEKEKTDLKKLLKDKAITILQERIHSSSQAMKEAQLAANDEGKSSVGDKYQTARAMAHIDRDIHARQLETAQKELAFIQKTDVSLFCKIIEVGAFVETNSGKYFFLLGLGPIEIVNEKIFFLSISSPIGKSFSGKEAGDMVIFNGKEFLIKNVF